MSSRWLALLCCSLACAADARLDSLRVTLSGMRDVRTSEGEKVRGATPKLTAVKHELRDWVEMRIKEFSRDGDEHDLARTLNSELHAAGLNCNWKNPSERCPEWIYLGYVSDIQLRRSGDFLILITGGWHRVRFRRLGILVWLVPGRVEAGLAKRAKRIH